MSFPLVLRWPDGWRAPTRPELSGQPSLHGDRTKYVKARGDYNGDGLFDYAYILKSMTTANNALFVRLSSSDGYKWLLISEYGPGVASPAVAMGIQTVPSGIYKTACGKGYWECGPDEPAKVKLDNQGIDHFFFESASSTWFWDKFVGRFAVFASTD